MMNKVCGNCKFVEDMSDENTTYSLFCNMSTAEIYIAEGYGIEVMRGVKPDETCDKWKAKKGVNHE
jgi:hypothetical protein